MQLMNASKSQVMVHIRGKCLIRSNVRCLLLLGIDPLEVANEGKVVMEFPDEAETILKILKGHKYGRMRRLLELSAKEGVIMETGLVVSGLLNAHGRSGAACLLKLISINFL